MWKTTSPFDVEIVRGYTGNSTLPLNTAESQGAGHTQAGITLQAGAVCHSEKPENTTHWTEMTDNIYAV